MGTRKLKGQRNNETYNSLNACKALTMVQYPWDIYRDKKQKIKLTCGMSAKR